MTKLLQLVFIFCLLYIAGAQAQNSPPTLISPTDSAKNQQPVVTFRWKADSTAASFNLEVSTSSSFSSSGTNLYKGITATSYRITGVNASTTYYWRVKSYFTSGDSSDNSNIYSFTTGNAPTAKIYTSTPSVCVNHTVNLSSASTGLAPMTYSWTFSGGSISSSTLANPSIYFTSAGTYTVTLTVTNAFGSDTITDYIEVLEKISGSSIIRKDIGNCAAAGVELTVNSTGTFYKWSNGATTKSITVKDTGVYGVVVSNGACSEFIYIRIDYKVFPLKISASSDLCPGDSVQLDAGAGFASYKWNTGETTRTIYVKNADSLFYVKAISADSCPYFGSKIVKYKYDSAFKIIVSGLTINRICSGVVTLSVPKITGLGKIKWSTGDTTSSIIITTPGYYSVSAEDVNGCKANAGIDVNYQKVKCMLGTYTVGGTNPDFKTIAEANDTLQHNLIIGDITLNIRDGIYTHSSPLYVGFNGMVSGKHKVTFQSESGNASKVKLDLTYPSNFTGIQISTANISFKNLSIINSGGSRIAVDVQQFADNAIFEGNIITDKDYASGNTLLRIISDNTIVSGNIFSGGSHGVLLSKADYAMIEKNKFGGQIKSMIQVNFGKSIRISKNITAYYSRAASHTNNVTGINLTSVEDFVINGNNFTLQDSNNTVNYLHYGLQLKNCQNSDSTSSHIYNNIIYGSMFGIYADSISSINFYHNNIYSANKGIYLINANKIGLVNNNIYNGVNAPSGKYNFRELKTNNYYPKPAQSSSIPEVVNLNGGSVSVDPLFPNIKNLFAKNTKLDKAGTVIKSIGTDIHGNQRDMKNADIGSEELLEINDLALDSILLPAEKCGLSKSESLQFKIKNLSNIITQTIPAGAGNITFGYKLNNQSAVTLNSNLTQPQIISYSGSHVMIYTSLLNLETPGTYNLKVWVSMLNDTNRNNDTLSIVINSKATSKSSFDFSGYCVGNKTSFVNKTTYTGSEPQYTWVFPNGSRQTAKNASFVFNAPGMYDVKLISVSASGCKDSFTRSVTIYSFPDTKITRNWKTLTTTPYGTHYQWLFNGVPLDLATSYRWIAEKDGKYSVIVKNAGGCTDTSEEYNFIYTGIENEDISLNIEIYPNPTNGKMVISGLETQTKLNSINVYDVFGKCVYSELLSNKTSGNIALNLGSLKAGIYWLQLTGDTGKIIKKVVIY